MAGPAVIAELLKYKKHRLRAELHFPPVDTWTAHIATLNSDGYFEPERLAFVSLSKNALPEWASRPRRGKFLKVNWMDCRRHCAVSFECYSSRGRSQPAERAPRPRSDKFLNFKRMDCRRHWADVYERCSRGGQITPAVATDARFFSGVMGERTSQLIRSAVLFAWALLQRSREHLAFSARALPAQMAVDQGSGVVGGGHSLAQPRGPKRKGPTHELASTGRADASEAVKEDGASRIARDAESYGKGRGSHEEGG